MRFKKIDFSVGKQYVTLIFVTIKIFFAAIAGLWFMFLALHWTKKNVQVSFDKYVAFNAFFLKILGSLRNRASVFVFCYIQKK